jgi:hypothetical protein
MLDFIFLNVYYFAAVCILQSYEFAISIAFRNGDVAFSRSKILRFVILHLE